MKTASILLVLPGILALACTAASPARNAAPTTAPTAAPTTEAEDVAEGQEVLATVKAFEPKSYTDDLTDGTVLVSDMVKFEVVRPAELSGVTVVAYYRGILEVEGRRLALGDMLYFKLPSAPRRAGIFFGDLEGLHFQN